MTIENILIVILILVILLVLPFFTMFGWSLFMVPVFKLAPITYSQACGLILLTGGTGAAFNSSSKK